jgi:thymidylate synthase (FAD)
MIGYDARVTSISMPTEELQEVYGVTTPQQLLAYYARVSNEQNQRNHKSGASLIRALIRREEWSPLEMVDVAAEIVATRDIGRQILRHSSLRPQEFSQRYAEVHSDKPIFRELRYQDPIDRQGSLEADLSDPAQQADYNWWLAAQGEVWLRNTSVYQEALRRGIAKEQARAVLPEGLTPTRMYFKGNMRDWYHYTRIRTKLSTQKEHRFIAQKCWTLILKYFPDIPDHRETVNEFLTDPTFAQ